MRNEPDGLTLTDKHNEQITSKLKKFLEYSNRYHHIDNAKKYRPDLDPGGIYTGIWCRDASFILRDWFESGMVHQVLDHLRIIWSYQIRPGSKQRIVYGRGSPEMNFKPLLANEATRKRFEGALPTSIFNEQRIAEVFGRNPDIDSTALMIYATSLILSELLIDEVGPFVNEVHSSSRLKERSKTKSLPSASYTSLKKKVLYFTIPRMEKAIKYLEKRDVDNDYLLEQDHNEDWMDSIMRVGKVVYSNASWILALLNFAKLSRIGNSYYDDSKKVKRNLFHKSSDASIDRFEKLMDRVIQSVDQILWSEDDGSYVDIQKKEQHIGGPYRTLTQDVVLYLIAVRDVKNYYANVKHKKQFSKFTPRSNNRDGKGQSITYSNDRALSTLRAIRNRIWKKKWPLVTEVELKSTGPWFLKPYEYHNYTFWPWITALEMIARHGYGQADECNILFSKLTSTGEPHVHTLYEWVNPKSDTGEGAYPFRTGISSVRLAAMEILKSVRDKN